VIVEQSLVPKDLSTMGALMFLEVSPQVLPHRLIRFVFVTTSIALKTVELPMLVNMKSKLVFVVEMFTIVIADEISRFVDGL
jgi:hypothetical protein